MNPVSVLVNESDTFSIVCKSTGTPAPNLSWQHVFNGSTTEIENSTNFVIEEQLGESILTVSSVTYNHRGGYRCVGDNGVTNYIDSPEYDESMVTVQGRRRNV